MAREYSFEDAVVILVTSAQHQTFLPQYECALWPHKKDRNTSMASNTELCTCAKLLGPTTSIFMILRFATNQEIKHLGI